MSLKKIVLHGPAADNAGHYCDAGAELQVASTKAEASKAGFISADRARELVDGNRAVSASAAAAIEKASAAGPVVEEAPATAEAPTPQSPSSAREGK